MLLKEVELTSKNGASALPGFSICIEKKDGQRVRREYALLGVAIRFSGDHPCETPPPAPTLQDPSPLPVLDGPPPVSKPSLAERVKKRWHAWTGM